MSENGTSMWIDIETRDRLKKIADFYRRSLANQIRWFVIVEEARIEKLQATLAAPEELQENSAPTE